tara:strand:- start:1172 stop:1597 length:426 start_codon:yes stop_codon:yes gene_type:complete
MPKKTDKQSRIDELSKKYPAQASLLKLQKQAEKAAKSAYFGELYDMQELAQLTNNVSEFNPHGDYSIIYHNGLKYKLTPMQANVIRYMDKEHKKGKEEIFDKDILDHIGTSQLTISAVFKKTKIMNNVILRVYNNYYKLNI